MTKQCQVEGCSGKYNAKGYCHTHYKQMKKHGRITSLDWEAPERVCKRCGTSKPRDAYKTSRAEVCWECRLEYARQWRNTTEAGKYSKRKRILWRYNLTPEEYDAKLEEQNNRCAICGGTQDRPLVVDHDHKTGRVRDLLCHTCNTGIGSLQEDIELMRAAIAYVERWTA